MRNEKGQFVKGCKHSKETIEKIREKMKGNIWGFQKGHTPTDEVRRKLSEAHRGKKRPKSVGEKISKALTGKKLSEEHRKNIGKVQIGKKLSNETREKMSETHKRIGTGGWNKGKELSKEHRWAISKGLLNHDISIDEWVPKKREQRNDSAYQEWVRLVKNRDNWKCKINNKDCKGRLEVHHILSWRDFPELRYEVNNGITLCQVHHPRVRTEEKRLIPFFTGLVSVSSKII